MNSTKHRRLQNNSLFDIIEKRGFLRSFHDLTVALLFLWRKTQNKILKWLKERELEIRDDLEEIP